MRMDDKEQLYQERVNRFIITTNHQEPDRVPILSLVETFAIAYANSTIEECMQSLDKELIRNKAGMPGTCEGGHRPLRAGRRIYLRDEHGFALG